MASALGWYGPLIDLCRASSHIGDFVQLLVFVHRSTPLQYKSSKGGDLNLTEIQVGDDTRPYFRVSLWQKHMGSIVSAGDIILLQNVKIAKFGEAVEARTVQWSSLLCLIHPYESLISKGIEELVTGCRVGMTTKDKLKKVIKWVQLSQFTLCSIKLHSNQQTEYLQKNWKVLEEEMSTDCYSLSEVSQLRKSCKAIVRASIGEIFPQLTASAFGYSEKEKIFLSRRVYRTGDNNLVQDLISTGCQQCGSPIGSEFEQNAIPLYCSKSSSRLHAVCSIYRPFLLYVWDDSDYMPILVKNRAAEILFGNIKAEKVYSSYREQMLNQNPDPIRRCKGTNSGARFTNDLKVSGEEPLGSCALIGDKSLQMEEKRHHVVNFYKIWLLFLKLLLHQGNSPLKFEIIVDPGLDMQNGKLEMLSASMPCFGTK